MYRPEERSGAGHGAHGEPAARPQAELVPVGRSGPPLHADRISRPRDSEPGPGGGRCAGYRAAIALGPASGWRGGDRARGAGQLYRLEAAHARVALETSLAAHI